MLLNGRLGRVLPREGSATVCAVAAISVHDNLAAGQPTVSHGAADDKASGGVDMDNRVVIHQVCRDDFANHVVFKLVADFFEADVFGVLCRHDDRVDTGRHAIDVLNGDLALGVWAGPIHSAIFAEVGVFLKQLMGVLDGHWHQVGGLVTGVAKHHALVASALLAVQAFALGHTLRDVWALLL